MKKDRRWEVSSTIKETHGIDMERAVIMLHNANANITCNQQNPAGCARKSTLENEERSNSILTRHQIFQQFDVRGYSSVQPHTL